MNQTNDEDRGRNGNDDDKAPLYQTFLEPLGDYKFIPALMACEGACRSFPEPLPVKDVGTKQLPNATPKRSSEAPKMTSFID